METNCPHRRLPLKSNSSSNCCAHCAVRVQLPSDIQNADHWLTNFACCIPAQIATITAAQKRKTEPRNRTIRTIPLS